MKCKRKKCEKKFKRSWDKRVFCSAECYRAHISETKFSDEEVRLRKNASARRTRARKREKLNAEARERRAQEREARRSEGEHDDSDQSPIEVYERGEIAKAGPLCVRCKEPGANPFTSMCPTCFVESGGVREKKKAAKQHMEADLYTSFHSYSRNK